MLHIALTLVAGILDLVIVRFFNSGQSKRDSPWLSVDRRILHPGFEMDRVRINHRVALDDVGILSLEITRLIQPLLAIEIRVIHYQRISFPVADPIGVPEFYRRGQMTPPVSRNDAEVVEVFVKENDVASRLRDLQPTDGHIRARCAGAGTMRGWILKFFRRKRVP